MRAQLIKRTNELFSMKGKRKFFSALGRKSSIRQATSWSMIQKFRNLLGFFPAANKSQELRVSKKLVFNWSNFDITAFRHPLINQGFYPFQLARLFWCEKRLKCVELRFSRAESLLFCALYRLFRRKTRLFRASPRLSRVK